MNKFARVIDILAGRVLVRAWKSLHDRLTGIEGRLLTIDAALAKVPAQIAPNRRSIAEGRLWQQIAQVENFELRGPARSVIFTRNSYYHFFYLARALRRRGWRALTVSLEDPNGPNSNFYHGEDVNMWDPDPEQLRANAEAVFDFAKRYFDLMHFAGDRCMSFFPWHFGEDDPADILEWKGLGKRVAYSISGCHSATTQTSVDRWSRAGHGRMSMCDNCVWQKRDGACVDEMNDRWGIAMHRHCDLVFSELQPSLDHLSSRHANVVRGPVSMVLDPQVWSPGLNVPAAFRMTRESGEVLVYHAFGNYSSRDEGGRNIKGTPAIVEAVRRLREEGHSVRLMFFTSVPNHLVRFYQAQADIVVDQLWAGSWGANGRESLMLGKPVVGFVNSYEEDGSEPLEAIVSTPVVHATVESVYDVIKRLVENPQLRAEIGLRSRAFAMQWHSSDAGARRYEQAYDAMLARSIQVEKPLLVRIPQT